MFEVDGLPVIPEVFLRREPLSADIALESLHHIQMRDGCVITMMLDSDNMWLLLHGLLLWLLSLLLLILSGVEMFFLVVSQEIGAVEAKGLAAETLLGSFCHLSTKLTF